MKIALVHDYIKEYGGAERVLEALHEIWPDAPVYTSVYLPEYLGPHEDRFKSWNIRESWARYIPFKEKLISILRILSPFIFKSFNLSEYDVVIVSATGAYESNSIRIRNQESGIRKTAHVCYCHTPPRYLYGYATAREWKKNWVIRVIGEIANHFLRLVDFTAAQKVDYFIANSEEVRSRIKKFYRKDAVVIYPPVSIGHPEFISGSRSLGNEMLKQVQHDRKKYYLAGGRLARPKNIDLIVRACREHNLSLKVFGKPFGGYEEILGYKDTRILRKEKSPHIAISQYPNIQFLGEITDEEKFELMRNAKAYLFASEDEDFGITPVEAMSVGTPVVAFKGGGVLETIIDGKTGVFFDELSEEALYRAIKKLEKIKIKPEACIERAKKFSKERFKTEMQLFVNSVLKDRL